MNFFSERLRRLRLELDRTQYDMADLGGVSRPSYNRYEQGKAEPPCSFLINLKRNIPEMNMDYFALENAPMLISKVPSLLASAESDTHLYASVEGSGIDQRIDEIAERIRKVTPDLETRFRMYEGMLSLLDTTLQDVERKRNLSSDA